MTQKQFGEICNISRSLVSKWENEDCLPSIEKINIISNHFDISLDYLFSLSTKKNIVFDRKNLDYKLIGNRIKSIREKNNLTLRQLAKILNTSSSTISAYETGKRRLLTSFALDICKRYNVSMDWLYGKIDK